MKKLYKSDKRVFAGVCGGIAEYFNADPTIIRLIAVIITVLSCRTGIIIYIVGSLIIPQKPFSDHDGYDEYGDENNGRNHHFYGKDGGDDCGQKSGGADSSENMSGTPHSDKDFDTFFKKEDKK